MSKLAFVYLLSLAFVVVANDKAEKECFKGIEELQRSVEDLRFSITNKEDLAIVRSKMLLYFQQAPTVMFQCISVLDYDFTAPVHGTEPNYKKIVDCKTGYIEFFDQMKRVRDAYFSTSIEKLNVATSKLGPLAEKIAEKCEDTYP